MGYWQVLHTILINFYNDFDISSKLRRKWSNYLFDFKNHSVSECTRGTTDEMPWERTAVGASQRKLEQVSLCQLRSDRSYTKHLWLMSDISFGQSNQNTSEMWAHLRKRQLKQEARGSWYSFKKQHHFITIVLVVIKQMTLIWFILCAREFTLNYDR